MNIYGEYFYGNRISEYGLEHGYVDYGTLAKAFDCVLNNEIMNKTWELGEWEQESGFIDNSEQIDELQEQIDELDENTQKEQIDELTGKVDELQEKIDELRSDEEYQPDVYQTYIVSDRGAEILKECNEIVWYHSELDLYVWGVTHWGTSWDYVLTDIPCNTGKFE